MFSRITIVSLAKLFVFGLLIVNLVFEQGKASAAIPAVNSTDYAPIPAGMMGRETARATISERSGESDEIAFELQPEPMIAADVATRNFEDWQSWQVIPSMTQTAFFVYERGLEMGNNPQAFSKVGDGEISATWFLTDFDLGASYYDLGLYSGLQATIQYFHGSFGRPSQAARRGFNAQRVLDPSLADMEFCLTGETPVDCEIRLHRPSFALLSMGTNQVWQPEEFETGIREIIETLIHHGIVPVLSTKADNIEGDHRINLIIARLAIEYDLPVWNFWRAVQPLPNCGLQEDHEHLTYFPNDFGDSRAMDHAWPVRNLSALLVLEKLMNDTHR